MTPQRSAFFLLAFLLMASLAEATWPNDPLVNVPISIVPGEKADVYLCTDNLNGALIVWEDKRAGQ